MMLAKRELNVVDDALASSDVASIFIRCPYRLCVVWKMTETFRCKVTTHNPLTTWYTYEQTVAIWQTSTLAPWLGHQVPVHYEHSGNPGCLRKLHHELTVTTLPATLGRGLVEHEHGRRRGNLQEPP
jgi:hypothetical protein